MNGLNTARVVIIDDDRDDASGLLRALAQVGVGAVVYTGDVTELPPRKLQGIRLVAADMDLAGASSAPDATRIAPTLGVLQQLIDKNNGPYLTIAWTANPDLVALFSEEVKRLPCPPVRVVCISKHAVKTDGSFDPSRIMAELDDALNDAYPLSVLCTWEQVIHDAASHTALVTPEPSSQWTEEAHSMLSALLAASVNAGDLNDDTASLRALFDALNPLHADSLELMASTTDAGIVRALRKSAAASLNEATACHLNRRLLIGSSAGMPVPGSIYHAEQVARVIGKRRAEDFPVWSELERLLVTHGISPQETERLRPEMIPIFIEVTSACDFQRGSSSVARLIAGLAVPTNSLKSNKKKSLKQNDVSIRSLPPIHFDHSPLNGEYMLKWHARYLLTVPLVKLAKAKPICRLRQQPFVDLQAWVAGHAARPGYLSIG